VSPTVIAALIAGVFSIGAVVLANFATKVRRDLDDCLRERRQLKQVLQLTVSALVGLLPDKKRDELLVAVANALDDVAEKAA
jgi:hypothetical protein